MTDTKKMLNTNVADNVMKNIFCSKYFFRKRILIFYEL